MSGHNQEKGAEEGRRRGGSKGCACRHPLRQPTPPVTVTGARQTTVSGEGCGVRADRGYSAPPTPPCPAAALR